MAVPETMNAWVAKMGNRAPIRSRVPVPKVSANGLLVKLEAMGVCHSDCTLLTLDVPIYGMKREYVLGHEGVGSIAQIGAGVHEDTFQVGDKVVIHIFPGCNQPECLECSRGLQNLCKQEGNGSYGLEQDGMFAEYMVCQARAAIKVPPNVDMASAAVAADAVLTAFHAVKYTAAVKPAHTVVIYGLGGVGLNGLQRVLHLGAKRVLVVDKRQESLDEAIALGVPEEDCFCTADSQAKKIEEYIVENSIAIDIALDFVGHADTILSAQRIVRPAGTVVLVGLMSEHAPLIPMYVVLEARTIKGSYNGSLGSLEEVMQLMGQGVLKPKVETGSIEGLPKVLKDLDEGKVRNRMVLLPNWND